MEMANTEHPLADTAGDGTDMRATQGELEFTPSRRVHAAEAVVQKYGAPWDATDVIGASC